MNISATHLPSQPYTTPGHLGKVTSPKFNASSVEVAAPPSLDTTTAPVISSPNPTYAKPVSVNQSTPEATPEQASDNISRGDTPEAEQEPTVKTVAVDDSNDDQHNDEIYSEAELELISDLKMRDAEVIAHERAHASVGGQHTGSPSYSYKTGPDGVKYAVSGEVSIDTSRVPGDPQATLQKAQQIKAAALAPAEPSGQDRKVAAKAQQMATQARAEILEDNSGEGKTRSSAPHSEATVPEHFTRQQNLSIDDPDSDNRLDSNLQNKMEERSSHIHAFYQQSAHVSSPSKFNIQV